VELERDIRAVAIITRRLPYDIPEDPGVYAFWWVGERRKLLAASTHIILPGPGGRAVDVHFMHWWPNGLRYPCLYVGKSTNLRKRFCQHLMRGSDGRVHTIPASGRKQKAATTACQLRYGIEHIFPKERNPPDLIAKNVGFSYTVYPPEEIAERCFQEDFLIGKWRPWFNVDSEW
jgi:hypothetical protein